MTSFSSFTCLFRREHFTSFSFCFFLLQFCAEERTDFVPHFLLEEMEICVVGILDRKQCDITSRFFQFVVQFLSLSERNGMVILSVDDQKRRCSFCHEADRTACDCFFRIAHHVFAQQKGLRRCRTLLRITVLESAEIGRRVPRAGGLYGTGIFQIFSHIINGICRKRCHAGQITARRLSHHTDAVRINIEAIGMCSQITDSCFHILQRCRKFCLIACACSMSKKNPS